jgi:hypothetical protein
VDKAYGIHPNTASAWKRTFLEKGPDIFAQDSVVAQYERRIAELEQLVGKKEVEIALLEGGGLGVLGGNAHPFEDRSLRMDHPLGLFGLTIRSVSGQLFGPAQVYEPGSRHHRSRPEMSKNGSDMSPGIVTRDKE